MGLHTSAGPRLLCIFFDGLRLAIAPGSPCKYVRPDGRNRRTAPLTAGNNEEIIGTKS